MIHHDAVIGDRVSASSYDGQRVQGRDLHPGRSRPPRGGAPGLLKLERVGPKASIIRNGHIARNGVARPELAPPLFPGLGFHIRPSLLLSAILTLYSIHSARLIEVSHPPTPITNHCSTLLQDKTPTQKLITQPPVDHVYNLIIILKHTPVITIICLIDSSPV